MIAEKHKVFFSSYYSTAEKTSLSLSVVMLGLIVCCCFILHLGTLECAIPHCYVCGTIQGMVHSCKQALASYHVTCLK